MQIELELNAAGEVIGWHDDLLDAKNPYEVNEADLPKVIGQIYAGGVLSPKPLTAEDRYQELERIFNDKTAGLKKLAIDKPWMTDPEAIDNQYRVYEEMYKNALADRYDAATNGAIITANETAKANLADMTLLLNTVRGIIEAAIASDAPNVDDLLAQADSITTSTTYAEIQAMFNA